MVAKAKIGWYNHTNISGNTGTEEAYPDDHNDLPEPKF